MLGGRPRNADVVTRPCEHKARLVVALDDAPPALERIFRFLARNSELDVQLLTVELRQRPASFTVPPEYASGNDCGGNARAYFHDEACCNGKAGRAPGKVGVSANQPPQAG